MRHPIAITLLGVLLLGAGVHAIAQESPPNSSQAPAALGELTLHVVPQSHIDLAWFWRYDPHTLQVIVPHTLETAFDNMEKYPDYTFTFLQVPAIEPLETLSPDLFYRLRYYVHQSRAIGPGLPNPRASGANGRLAIGSASWVEFDGSLPCGESLVRQLVYGKRYYRQAFGIDVRTLWVQDAWTHPWTLPQLMKQCGIDSYMFSRPRGQGEPMFWWESPDGSRVFAYKPLNIGGDKLPPQDQIEARLRDTNRRYGVRDDITLVGVGNHGGGALRADVERMRQTMTAREQNPAQGNRPPRVVFSTPQRFVDAALAQPHPFPVVRNELEPTYRGAYTTVGEIKRGNRRSETLLLTLEKFASIASRLGERRYPQALIYDAWKKVMLNQFHDTISGTDIPPSIDDALRRDREVSEAGQAELHVCLTAIARRANTEGTGQPVVVFNPLAWTRNDLVEVEVPCESTPAAVEVVDAQGRRLPAQIVGQHRTHGKPSVTIAFEASDVPSLGYRTYWISLAAGRPAESATLVATADRLENAFFRLEIDPTTGTLRSVWDKEQEREVLAASGGGNLLQVLEDLGDSEGSLKQNVWNGPSWNVDTVPQITLVERGPARAVVEIKKKFHLARFTQRIILYHAIRRIDFEVSIAWKGSGQMVKVAFPLAVSSPEASYEIPYGVIRRPSQGAEHVAQNWVDVGDGNYGVSLLNDGRYGYDVTSNTIRMSLLRSPTSPVAATDEQGTHELKYALVPHAGTWQAAGVVRRGQELNNPLIPVLENPHAGDLPSACAFVEVEPENVVLNVLKKAEDSEQLIVRCYETMGTAAHARITWAPPLAADAVHATDLLETSQEDVPTSADGYSAELPPFGVRSYLWIRDRQ